MVRVGGWRMHYNYESPHRRSTGMCVKGLEHYQSNLRGDLCSPCPDQFGLCGLFLHVNGKLSRRSDGD